MVIIDARADNKTVYSLENMGFKTIPTIYLEQLYDDIATHADIQIAYIGRNYYISAPEVFEYYKSKLIGSNVICGEKNVGGHYPFDICYNAACLGTTVICSKKYTDKILLSNMETVLDVRQGYSKCSICIVNNQAIITDDTGIAKKAAEIGIDVLFIRKGSIKLLSGRTGFIGGVSGLLKKDLLAFNGDINLHEDSSEIKAFCRNHGVEIVCLKSGTLEDIGTIIANYDCE